MWYLSCTEWLGVNGIMEPKYHMKFAEYHDGINWIRDGTIAIDYKNPEEGWIVRAAIIKDSKQSYRMWFSCRWVSDYRVHSSSSYKIGYAKSLTGISWIRDGLRSGISISDSGWDSFMIAYQNILQFQDMALMFYNWNGFGVSGFGYALSSLQT